MPRSTTVWAAALVLASFSGSGPLLTTAEAMPAPGPQVTQGRPRYYFPRHVKRQIVTNSTAPAAPTLSSTTESSSTSSEKLESRQLDFTSAINSFFNRPGSSSSLFSSSSDKDSNSNTGTVTSSQNIVVTPSPDRNNSPPGTGNLRPPPSPTPRPEEPEDEDEPVRSSPPSQSSPSKGPVPEIVLPGTSSVSPEAVPEPTPSSSEPSRGLLAPVLSSVLDPVAGPTGLLPSLIVAPTPSPEVIPSPEPSSVSPSSFQGPFIVPGSTGGALPSSVIRPTPSQGLVGGLLSSLFDSPEPTPSQQPASTGGDLPSSIVLPTPVPASPSSDPPLLVLPSSGGIVVGITTALGTGAASPTPAEPLQSSVVIPTSEAVPSNPLDLTPVLSSAVSEVNGILPSGSAGPTAPVVTPSPEPTPSGVLPPLVSSLVSDVSGILSSIVPEIPASDVPIIISSILSEIPTPTPTGPIVLPSATDILSSFFTDVSGVFPTASPSGILPPPSGSVVTPSETPTPVQPPFTPSETPATPTPSASIVTPVVPSGTTSPSVSGIVPSGGQSGSGVTPIVTPTPTTDVPQSIPTSEVPPSSAPSSLNPPNATNGTIVESPVVSSLPPSPTADKPTTPPVTTQPPVQTQKPTGFDSATAMPIPSSIIREASTNPPVASPTSSGIPSSLPKMIEPPNGMGTLSTDNFLGQVCFKWPLNYPFISRNDAGNQIFYYLPKAISNGLNISETEVQNMGLKPLDTTAQQGFITTLALFTIPKDLQSTLQAQLRNPADAFWHHENQTVNELTGLINTACPLPAGGAYPGDGSPAQGSNPGAAPSGGAGDGGALGGDIGASRPINGSAAGIATGAIVGAIAYGAAMFFVARRYRNKRLAHQRASSVPSTGSRMTYGSIPGGAAAWMHGARNGRITPGSRGSRGSDSSQGRSVRTQQISAPVMAENSLGWN